MRSVGDSHFSNSGQCIPKTPDRLMCRSPDWRTEEYPGRYPTFRTSGINVNMRVDFVNYEPEAQSETWMNALYALAKRNNIRAEIRNLANPNSWAGLGPTIEYIQYPNGHVCSATLGRPSGQPYPPCLDVTRFLLAPWMAAFMGIIITRWSDIAREWYLT